MSLIATSASPPIDLSPFFLIQTMDKAPTPFRFYNEKSAGPRGEGEEELVDPVDKRIDEEGGERKTRKGKRGDRSLRGERMDLPLVFPFSRSARNGDRFRGVARRHLVMELIF